jgi:hypothetical protein
MMRMTQKLMAEPLLKFLAAEGETCEVVNGHA